MPSIIIKSFATHEVCLKRLTYNVSLEKIVFHRKKNVSQEKIMFHRKK